MKVALVRPLRGLRSTSLVGLSAGQTSARCGCQSRPGPFELTL